MLYYKQEVRNIKNITLRVDDDFHYSVKIYAAKKGVTLQQYMIETVTNDLIANNALTKPPLAELIDNLSAEEVRDLIGRLKEKVDKK